MRITIFLMLSLVLFLLLSKRLRCFEKSPRFTDFSKSIEESKEKGVFEFELAPLNSSQVFDSSHQLIIKKAWLEYGWASQVYLIGSTSIEKEDSHQLILIYDILKNHKQQISGVHYFIGGRTVRDSMVHYYCNKADTIKVPLYKESSSFLPSAKKRKAYDSLTFIRR